MLADHAAIDALFQRDHLVVDHHGKAGVGRDERSAEGPQAGIQMTIHASEVVAGIAVLRIGRVLADMRCRIDDQGMALENEIVNWTRREVGDVARIPIGRPAPDDIAGAKPRCQRGDQRDPNHPATMRHGLITH